MNEKTIYLDNSATTAVDSEVIQAMLPYFNEMYGNPGSMHHKGLQSQKAIEEARKKIAGILNCDQEEIIFTGGGTESINLALKGVAHHQSKKLGKGNHIITQKTEHPAVLETCEFLEKEGYEVTYLEVDKYGRVNPKDVETAIKDETILVSVMYANNEIGTVQPIKEISEICKKKGVLLHTDACQAPGYLDLDVKKLGVDLMSLNASKAYGPKGIGLLFLRRGISLTPLIHGGGQERRLRSGTENVPSIVGFAKALEIAESKRVEEGKRLKRLSQRLISGVTTTIPKSFLNGHPTERLPNNANITFLDIEGEAALLYLDKEEICASSGSACTSKTLDPSHVILALGLPYEAAHGSLRFSLGRTTTEKGIDKLIKTLQKIVGDLRKISPVNLNAEDFTDYLSQENKAISIRAK